MTDPLYQRVQQTLKTLALTTMPLHLDQLTQQAATENWSALQFLEALTETVVLGILSKLLNEIR